MGGMVAFCLFLSMSIAGEFGVFALILRNKAVAVLRSTSSRNVLQRAGMYSFGVGSWPEWSF